MNGEELYQLGKSGSAARVCVPLNFCHTPPRISFEETWQAEFWYYLVDYDEEAVYSPQYYLQLELPSGKPVRFSRLKKSNSCLGPVPELAADTYYQLQNQYLQACAALIEQENPDLGQIELLQRQWLEIQPKMLMRWLAGQKLEPGELPRQEADDPTPAMDLVSYWKQEMWKAVKAGDTAKADEAQEALLEATRQRQKKLY